MNKSGTTMISGNEECKRLAEYHEHERRFCKETQERLMTSKYSGTSPTDEADWLSEILVAYSFLEGQHLFYREMFLEKLQHSGIGGRRSYPP
jgi:hypothetical protein